MKDIATASLRNYFPFIVSGIISLVLVIVLIIPALQNIPTQAEESTRLLQEVQVLDQKNKTLQSLDVSELTEMIQKVDVALPTEKSFPGLLSGLEALTLEAGSTFLTFDASPGVISRIKRATTSAAVSQSQILESEAEKSLGIKFLEADIGINSNAASLVDLASTLTKSSRLVTLEKVSFKSSDIRAVDSANTNIKLRVYYQPEGATAAANIQFLEVSQEEKDLISKVDLFNRFTLELPSFLPSREDPFSSLPAVPQGSSSSSVQP